MNKYVLTLIVAFACCGVANAKVNTVIPGMNGGTGMNKMALPGDPAAMGMNTHVLSFVENKGQVKDQFHKPRPDIQFMLPATTGLNIFVGNGAIHYQFSKADKHAEATGMNAGFKESIENNPGNYTLYRMDVELVGANKHATVTTDEAQSYVETYKNEMTGPEGTTAHSFNRITYKDVYPNIDWVLYTSNGELKHEFIVRQGGKIADIKLKYGGATDLRLDNQGGLVAVTPQGNITEKAPYTYEQSGKQVKSSFRLNGNTISYQADSYNGTLVIDPSIGWATYFYSSTNAYGLVSDPAGNVYMTGMSQVPGMATTGAYQTTYMGGDDGYIAKFTTCGALVWCTYFGGANQEVSSALASDASGNLYVTGCTRSASGVTTPGCYRSSFIVGAGNYHPFLAKFTNSGAIVWSTYYGGDQTDQAFGVALDKSGNVYMSATTRSTTGIATPGADQTAIVGLGDAFLAKFTVGGTLVWATYFGGNSYEQGSGVAVDKFDNPYMSGVTISPTGVATPGSFQSTFGGGAPGIAYDAYLVKYNASGVKQWATYYGGTGNEQSKVSAVADTFDGIYISGYTNGNNGISSPGAYQTTPLATTNAFVAKFSTSGARRWGTYFGGNGGSYGYGLAITDSQQIFLTGGTYSSTGMVTPGAYKTSLSGAYDAYIGKFDTGGMLKMCTYVGGNANDDAYYIATHDSAVFICGNTTSTDFATPGSFQPTTTGGGAYLMRLDLGVSNTLMQPIVGPIGICAGSSMTLSDATPFGVWKSASTSIATVNSGGVVTGVSAGTAVISYTITNFCGAKSVMDTITVFPTASVITGNTKICVGTSSLLSDPVPGGTWTSGNTSVATVFPGVGNVTGVSAGTAVITYVLGAACDANVTVTVIPVTAITGPTKVCTGSVITLGYSTTGGTWSSSNTSIASIGTTGTTTAAIVGIAQGTATITYTINVGCYVTSTLTVNLTPTAITGPFQVCNASTITLSDATPGGSWSSANTSIAIVDALTGDVTGTSKGPVNIIYTSAEGCTVFKNITVNPIQPIIAPASICVTSATKLIDSVTGGTWSTTNTTISIGVTSGIVSGLALGSATITYLLPTGCSATAVLNINPMPSVIAGPSYICGTSTVPFSDTLGGGTWTSSNTSVAIIDPVLGNGTGVSLGSTTIYYSTGTGCTVSKTVTVSPVASPITGAADMCAGGTTITVFDTDPMGIWTSTLVTITTTGLVTAYAPGAAVVTYTLPTGCAAKVSFTVNPLPGAITSPATVCTGTLIAPADTTTGGVWGSASTTVMVDATTGATYGLLPGTAIITYTLPTTCTVADTITVFPTPTAILGTKDICLSGLTNLSDTTLGGSWSIAPSGIASIGATTGDVSGIATGTTIVTYTTGPGCTATAVVTVMPLPTVFSVTGGGSYCAGGSGVHVLLSGSTVGVRYYIYYGTFLSDSSDGTGGFRDFGAQIFAGTYTVTATNLATQCTNDMSGSALVTVNPILVPAITIGVVPNDTVCQGTSLSFLTFTTNGGSAPKYQWKVNSVVVGTTNTYSYTPVDGDVVTVSLVSNATCADPTTAYDFTTISVVTPVIPDVTISADPDVSVPKGTKVTYTATVNNLSLLPSPTYQWTKLGVDIPGATGPTYVNNNPVDLDIITCKVASGGMCTKTGTSNKVYMNVYPLGVEQLQGTATISIIPNPNKGVFAITGSLGVTADEEVSLEMTDMLGQVVYKGNTIAKNGNINESIQLQQTIANGMYLLNVRSAGINKVFHIVVEK